MELLEKHQGELLKIKVAPEKIDLVNKFIEAYDNCALVTTIDAKEGLLALWVTPDTCTLAKKVLKYIPVNVEFIENVD